MKEQVEKAISMGNNVKENRAPSLPSAGKWATVAGLLAFSAAVFLVMALDGRVDAPGVLFALTPLVLAGLVLTGNRWLILVVALVTALAFVFGIRAPMLQERLAHPEHIGYFAVAALELLGSAIAAVAGLITVGQSFVGRERSLSQPDRAGSADR